MSEGRNDDADFIDDRCLNQWEQQASQEIETSENSHSQVLQDETSATQQRLWDLFQNAAQCVAVMYKGSVDHPATMWTPFQTAAGNITSLYKESVDGLRKVNDLAIQAGYHKRNKELLGMVRRRRTLRRDELLALLAGKTLPSRSSHIRGSPRTRIALERMPQFSNQQSHMQIAEDNLNTFKEAIGVHASIQTNNFAPRRRNSGHQHDLQSFMNSEFARNKRSAPPSSPPHDVTMDSPQHKRFKHS